MREASATTVQRTTGHVFIATSLDGYIAGPDGDLGWLAPYASNGENSGYEAFIASVDGLLMGRRTYQKVLSFGAWPYNKPVLVLSRSLTATDIRSDVRTKVEVTDCTPSQVMTDVSARGWRRAYVDGGAVVSAFLGAGLIQDIVITRVPIVLGSGVPLFTGLNRSIRLRHSGTLAFPSGLVQSRYELENGSDQQAGRSHS